MERIIQPSLFTEHLSANRLVAETKLRNLGRDRVAFGVTKTGLKKASYGTLENIFYGMRNIKIPLEMLSIENPAEILSNYSATNYLKRRGAHLDPNIPHEFFELVEYLNSFKIGFASLADEFKECFDIEQEIRLGLLKKSVRDSFVKSFFADYKSSNKEDPVGYDFGNPNYDGESKEVYVNIIYDELESLSEKVKESLE